MSTRFESCWPALRVGVKGVILVCSSNNVNTAPKELELLYNYFVSQAKLSAKQCVVFYNCSDDQDDMDSLNLCMYILIIFKYSYVKLYTYIIIVLTASTFSKVSQVTVNLKSGGNRLKIDFSNFVTSILQTLNK